MFVPVVDKDQNPLMPTTPARAKKWMKSGKATYFWKKGVFCVRLNVEPSGNEKQEIAVGIDPGSKKEGYTVKSTSHTFLNIQADTPFWVKKHIKQRSMMRHNRRYRKTPCRQSRSNRKGTALPPSTKARWQWKLRLCNWLMNMFPVSTFIVEDIKAVSKKGQRRWNVSFSPLQTGKKWFYSELGKLAPVETKQGYETKAVREGLRLKKSSSKLANIFEAHCIDSWVLANSIVGGHKKPDNESMLLIAPLRLHRRQLHNLQFAKGRFRRSYGGTRSLGFKRGSWVKHPKWELCYVGGTMGDRISLYNLKTGKRLTQLAKPEDCKFLTYASWRVWPLPQ